MPNKIKATKEEILREFKEKFPNISVIDGVGESGGINGFDATPYVKDFLTSSIDKILKAVDEVINDEIKECQIVQDKYRIDENTDEEPWRDEIYALTNLRLKLTPTTKGKE